MAGGIHTCLLRAGEGGPTPETRSSCSCCLSSFPIAMIYLFDYIYMRINSRGQVPHGCDLQLQDAGCDSEAQVRVMEHRKADRPVAGRTMNEKEEA